MPIEYIPWSQITHINYGLTAEDRNDIPTLSNRDQLKKLLDEAHKNGVKVLLSIGRWQNAEWMDEMLSIPEKRTKFIDKLTQWVNDLDLDGKLDIHSLRDDLLNTDVSGMKKALI